MRRGVKGTIRRPTFGFKTREVHKAREKVRKVRRKEPIGVSGYAQSNVKESTGQGALSNYFCWIRTLSCTD